MSGANLQHGKLVPGARPLVAVQPASQVHHVCQEPRALHMAQEAVSQPAVGRRARNQPWDVCNHDRARSRPRGSQRAQLRAQRCEGVRRNLRMMSQ